MVNGSTQSDPFLDITDLTDDSGEQGLLSMAFHPDFATNGLVYAYYTDEDNGDIVVSEFETISPLDADEASGREVIRIKHRFASNHNGGHITFGPDGFLYISTGDGGDANDPGRTARTSDSLLASSCGSIRSRAATTPTPCPSSNPFVGKAGADEVYAFGLRNPFRMNFDPETEWLAIGDVGQDRFEEVDMESADTLRGANFGWDRYEGFKQVKSGGTAKTPRRRSTRSRPSPTTTTRARRSSAASWSATRISQTSSGATSSPTSTQTACGASSRSLGKVKDYVELDNDVDSISSFSQDPATREVYVTSRGDGALYRLEPAAP